jgi:hypothetical protein
MPKATHVPTTSRRTLLGRAAAAAPALVLPAVARAVETDPLVALGRRFDELHESPLWIHPDEDVRDAHSDAWDQALAAIAHARSVTFAGVRVKARQVVRELTDEQTAYGDALAEGLLADLDRLAGMA